MEVLVRAQGQQSTAVSRSASHARDPKSGWGTSGRRIGMKCELGPPALLLLAIAMTMAALLYAYSLALDVLSLINEAESLPGMQSSLLLSQHDATTNISDVISMDVKGVLLQARGRSGGGSGDLRMQLLAQTLMKELKEQRKELLEQRRILAKLLEEQPTSTRLSVGGRVQLEPEAQGTVITQPETSPADRTKGAEGLPEERWKSRVMGRSHSAETCKRAGVAPLSPSQKLRWNPRPERYLLATCTRGRMSNRALCMGQYVLAAVLLQRTLVVPNMDLNPTTGPRSGGHKGHLPYRLDLVFNIDHARRCSGHSRSILSLDEYREQQEAAGQPKVLPVDRFVCWMPKKFCARSWSIMTQDHQHILFPQIAESPSSNISSPVTMEEFLATFGHLDDRVISLGDLFSSEISDAPPLHRLLSWYHNGTTQRKCQLVIRPHDAVIQTAQRFVSQVTGTRFASLHLRRSDFYRDVPEPQRGLKYWSIHQVAECISQRLQESPLGGMDNERGGWGGGGRGGEDDRGAKEGREGVASEGLGGSQMLFVATDAAESDVNLLQALLTASSRPDRPIALVRLPSMKGAAWAKSLSKMSLAQDALAIALVEKLVCSMGSSFFASPRSSFSAHINQMRTAFGVSTCSDQFICEGLEWKDPIPSSLTVFAV